MRIVENWGNGAYNNTIGWGQGHKNNAINWGISHAFSYSGYTNITGD